MASADVELLRRSHPGYVAESERHLRRNFLLITGDMACFAFAIALLSETTILPAFVKSLTDAPLALGVLSALYAVGRFGPQLIGAHLSMGCRRRKPLVLWVAIAERVGILSLALVAQTLDILPASTVLIVFMAAYGFYTITTGLIMPPYGELFSKSILRHRGRLYGGVQLIGGLLGAAGALVANRLLGSLPHPDGYQAVFWLAFGLSFLSLGFIAGIKEVPFPESKPRGSFGDLVRSVPPLLRQNDSFRWFLVGRSAIALGTSGLGFVAAAALDRGLTAADAAGLASAYLVSQSVGGLGWGLIGDRLGWKIVLLGGGISLTLGMAVAVVASGFWPFATSFAFLGLTYAATLTSDPNITYEVAPPQDTSRYLGVTSTLTAPALTLAPLFGALLASIGSYEWLFGVSAVLAVLGVVVATLKFEEPRRQTGDLAIPTPISG